VSQRICQSPWTERTAPWAAAWPANVEIAASKTAAPASAGAIGRIRRPTTKIAMMCSPGQPPPSHPDRPLARITDTGRLLAKACLHREPSVSRSDQDQAIVAARRRRRTAVSSALRERPICGLTGWDFLVPPTPVKDQIRGKTRPATGSVGPYRFAQTCTWHTCLPSRGRVEAMVATALNEERAEPRRRCRCSHAWAQGR